MLNPKNFYYLKGQIDTGLGRYDPPSGEPPEEAEILTKPRIPKGPTRLLGSNLLPKIAYKNTFDNKIDTINPSIKSIRLRFDSLKFKPANPKAETVGITPNRKAMASDKGYYHDKGQKDSSENRYDPPNQGPPIISDVVNAFRSNEQKDNEKSYNQGWYHTNDQKKR